MKISDKLKTFKLKNKPILIGGKALEYYGLRKSYDWDFIISEHDFEKMKQEFGQFHDFPKNTPGVKLFYETANDELEIDMFVSMYDKFNYNSLIKKSLSDKHYNVIDLTDLLKLIAKNLP
mgnify:CR=1 FL=1